MAISKFKIEDKDRDKRLDHFLVENFPEESRSFLQKQIKNGAVTVNGEMPSVHQFLKIGDKVEIKIEKKKIKKKEPPKYKLVFECDDYLIIEKPAGVLTHSDGIDLGLADAIIKDYPEIKKIGDKGRWGIVHRLDKDVSGLLVVARTKKFFEYIKKQFSERLIKKIYLALVYGEVPRDEETLEFSIARSSEGGKMAARPKDDEDSREAKTHIQVLKKFKNYTYLEVQIFTGRTHQIRAHLLAYGYPVVGDNLYRLRRQRVKNPGCERLFLHSHKLGFNNMEGKFVEYKSKLPKELNEVLEIL
ncbi:MAG: RluA family pseudouridine synthase [Patescibacteria group bacterium]